MLDHLEEVDKDSKFSVEVDVATPLADAGNAEVFWQGTSTKKATPDQCLAKGIISGMSQELASATPELATSMQARLSIVACAVRESH